MTDNSGNDPGHGGPGSPLAQAAEESHAPSGEAGSSADSASGPGGPQGAPGPNPGPYGAAQSLSGASSGFQGGPPPYGGPPFGGYSGAASPPGGPPSYGGPPFGGYGGAASSPGGPPPYGGPPSGGPPSGGYSGASSPPGGPPPYGGSPGGPPPSGHGMGPWPYGSSGPPPVKRYIPSGPGGPPSPPKKTSWLSWPVVFLVVSLILIGSCNYNISSSVRSLKTSTSMDLLSQPAIGVLAVEGEIFDTRWAIDALEDFGRNRHVKALVLRIDSPGGAVAPCQELYGVLEDFEKPVVVSMGSVAASGGLYLAVAGNPHIMASPGTITGSIGVIMETVEVDEAMGKLGIKSQIIKSGPYKDMGSPFRAMRDDERALLNSMVDSVWKQFVKDVQTGRPKLTEEQVKSMADGRIFTGEEALRLGLVDELGGYKEAIEVAKRLSGLSPDDDPQIIYENGRRPWIDDLLGTKLGFLSPLERAAGNGPALKFLYRPGLF